MIIGSNGSIVSQLFTDFAEPLGLYESQLTILHASDHRDAQLVADIWNALLLRGQSFCRTTCDRDDTDDRASSADHEAEDLSPSQRYRPFQDLVVRLGKRFYPSHAAFPTGKSAVTTRNGLLSCQTDRLISTLPLV